MSAGNTFDHDELKPLIASLSTNGWDRHSADLPPLSTVVEIRTRERCQEPAMHRGGALENLCVKIQEAYDDYTRYRSSAPDEMQSDLDTAREQSQKPRTSTRSDQ